MDYFVMAGNEKAGAGGTMFDVLFRVFQKTFILPRIRKRKPPAM